MRFIIFILCLAFSAAGNAQNFTSFFTGSESDLASSPEGGICMMGGATEDDNAMIWFLERAKGGDVLVLRASGSDGYNDYMYSELGVNVNSVETILFNDATANQESYIHKKIQKAEAIWFAGGDQWKYISFWRNSPIDSLIRQAVKERNVVIGGTSAGMVILGGHYYSAEIGSVTSEEALANPYHEYVTIDSSHFLDLKYMQNVITDTHYDERERKGRHVTFMARMLTDYGNRPFGIACDEYTAVCIDTFGKARTFGEYPDFEDMVYFIQPYCRIINNVPEECSPENALIWNQDGEALKVYKVYGTPAGEKSFNLNDWETGDGGSWENWYVDDGVLFEEPGSAFNCLTLAIDEDDKLENSIIYPNPTQDAVTLKCESCQNQQYRLQILNKMGQKVLFIKGDIDQELALDVNHLRAGFYTVQLHLQSGQSYFSKLIIQ